jgi:UDP-N-acetylglucosamine:LPS N-acetylglucosamine transferase
MQHPGQNRRISPDARVLLVCANGGHLAQLAALRPWWADRDRAWVTFQTPDAEALLADEPTVHWAHHPTTRNIPNLMRNTVLARRVMREFRPDVVVSTGAGVALPFFTLARRMDALTVYIEVYDRIDTATLTGRLCRPFTDVMAVQWEEQLGLYRSAHLVGQLL